MERSRRGFLERVCVAVPILAAGCSEPDPNADGTVEPRGTDGSDADPGGSAAFEPPTIRVRNLTDASRELRLRVFGDDEVIFERAVAVDQEIERYDPGIEEKGRYVVEVEYGGETSSFPFTVEGYGRDVIVEVRDDRVDVLQEE